MPEISTIRDVARRAGVSLGTVSNYLNGTKNVSEAASKRIAEAIEELSFIPNTGPRVMRGHRSPAIGFAVTEDSDAFFAEVGRGIDDVARGVDYVTVSCFSNGSLDQERKYIRALAQMRVAGVVVVPGFAPDDHTHLDQLERSGTPVVYLGSDPGERIACSATVDGEAAGRMAGVHLLELGHRNIMFVGVPAGERQIRDRLAGMARAFSDFGLDPSLIRRMDVTDTSISAKADVARRILDLPDRPTALFCANDTVALAIEGMFLREGVRIPEDVAIVGHNDIEQASLAAVPITTIHVPSFELGRTAALMLLREGEPDHEHQRVIFDSQLVVRESTVGRRAI